MLYSSKVFWNKFSLALGLGSVLCCVMQAQTVRTRYQPDSIRAANRATLCRYCRASLIPHTRMPDHSYRFDPVALQGWLRQRTVG
jgi:hypothetical protein